MGSRRNVFSGSSSSSNINCDFCNVKYKLYGTKWHDSTITALFVFTCMACAVLLACMVLASFFKWLRPRGGRATARTGIYLIALVATFLSLLILLVDTGLREEETTVTFLYNIIYIFFSLFSRIGELLILAVIFRTIYVLSLSSNLSHLIAKGLHILQIAMIGILALLTTAAFGLDTAGYINRIINGPSTEFEYERFREASRVGTAYQVLYLVSAIVLLVIAILASRKATVSFKCKLLLLLTTGALLWRSFYDMIDEVVINYPSNLKKADINFDWATQYFNVFTTPIIFLCLGLYACVAPPPGTGSAYGTHGAGTEGLGGAGVAGGKPVLNQYGGVGTPMTSQGVGMDRGGAGPGWKGKWWNGYPAVKSQPVPKSEL